MTIQPACQAVIYRKQMLIQNKQQETYTVNKPKIALNRNNDKRRV